MVKLKRSTPSLSKDTPSLKRTAPELKRRRASLNGEMAPTAEGQDGEIPTEAMAEEELGEVLSGFKKRANQENDRFRYAVDSEFWFAVCFQTRDQKEEFLRAIGFDMNLEGDKYLDGMALARALGIKLTSPIPRVPEFRVDPKAVGLSLPIEEDE